MHGRLNPGRVSPCAAATKSGFTLIEILVVIAIIGILVALLLPAIQAARESVRRAQCSNNLHQIGIALHQYHQIHSCFPSSVVGTNASAPLHTWMVMILPQLEQRAMFDAYNCNVRYNDPANTTIVTTAVSTYLCPSASSSGVLPDGFAGNNYAASSGTVPGLTEGVMFPSSRVRFAEIRDGTSTTIATGEIYFDNLGWARGAASGADSGGGGGAGAGFARGVSRWWRCASDCALPGFNPRPSGCNNNCEQRFQFSSNHPGGAMFGFADSHVQFLSQTMDVNVFRAMITRNGQELFDY